MATVTSTRDPRVETAISHWAPRFISNGVLLADFEDVTRSLARWEDWCAAWSARAAVHEKLGREALAEDHRLSAGEHLGRAAVYYHFAKFLFVHDVAQMRAAHMWGGETTAADLRRIADVVDKYAIPTVKVTGGQRIDLLGVKKEDLPQVWKDLGMFGGWGLYHRDAFFALIVHDTL